MGLAQPVYREKRVRVATFQPSWLLSNFVRVGSSNSKLTSNGSRTCAAIGKLLDTFPVEARFATLVGPLAFGHCNTFKLTLAADIGFSG